MSERKDSPEQAEFREHCRRWLEANHPGRSSVPSAAESHRGHEGGAARLALRVAEEGVPGRAHRLRLSQGIRRRRTSRIPAHRQRGGRARRRAVLHQRHRPRHGRADDSEPRHRRAEATVPPAALLGRRDLVPRIQRARLRLRSGGRADLCRAQGRPMGDQRPQGVDEPRALRELDDHPRAHQPRSQVRRPLVLHRADRGRGRA